MSEPDRPQTPPPSPPQYGAYPGSYPPPPPQPYASYAPPPPAPKNGLGVAALVIAIVALVLCWSVAGGLILGVCAMIIGFVARGRVKRGEATNGGVATAGVVLGVLAIIVSLVFIPIWVGIFNEVGGSNYVDCLSNAGSDEQAIQQCADQFRDRLETEFSITITPTP
jgi:Domain of unknown function (DUF4190)